MWFLLCSGYQRISTGVLRSAKRTINTKAQEGKRNISLVIDRDLETKIRVRAEAEGLSIEAYLERLVQADQDEAGEFEARALEGLHSGAPIEGGPSYWKEKHRLLDERLSKTNRR